MSDLRNRAHGNEVERRPQGQTLQHQIKEMEAQFALAMPKGAEAAQLVRDALTLLRTTPKLAECDPKTVLGGLMTCAQLGLRPGVLGHAYLLPFWDSKSRSNKAQLVVGYQGLAELGYRSDRVAGISARTVFDGEPFAVEFGTEDRIHHTPLLDGSRGKPVAYYAVVHIKGGRPIFFVMSHRDMEKYRDDHAKARTKDGTIVGPWRDHFEGMAHKTCLRQLAKWMPKSTELATALQVDEGVRVDLVSGAAEATHHYADAERVDTVTGEVLDPQQPEGGEQA